jgi:tRNA threonylcarbamoyladenosine dehydratase
LTGIICSNGIGGIGGCSLHSRYSDQRFTLLLHNTPNHHATIGIDSNKDITIDDSTNNNNDVTGNVIMNLNNTTNDDRDDDDDDDDYHIRFRGIGQLYTSSATTTTFHPVDPILIMEDSIYNTTTVTNIPHSSSSSSPPLPTDTTTTTTVAEVMENSSIVLQRLQNAVVVVVGVGGVGSWTVEALGRSGIGTIILMDMDDICFSNVNRQLHALSNTIGSMKIDILYQRLQQINPHCIVHRIYDFISTDNIYDLFDTINANWGVPTTTSEQDDCIDNTTNTGNNDNMSIMKRVTAVLDCIDSAREKAALLAYCNHRMIPICTVGSTAGRTNPALVTFGDITHVHTSSMGHSRDRLLTTVRKELRQQYNFIPGRPYGRKSKPWLIPCVYSVEEVAIPEQPSPLTTVLMDTATTNSNNNNDNAVPGSSSSFRQCDNGVLGNASFVTGTFGFVAASIIVQGIAQNQLHPPRGTSIIHNNK